MNGLPHSDPFKEMKCMYELFDRFIWQVDERRFLLDRALMSIRDKEQNNALFSRLNSAS